jgi:hypothetical protein
VAPHLGNFVTALEQAKRLTPDQAELAHSIVRQLQAKVSELDHYSGPDPAIILKDILPAVAMLMGLFPASAPFVPVLIALQALLAAYLANRPVQAPDGQPVPPPAPPANLRQLYQVEPE